MGIRIDAFAIDTPRFERLLEFPLWQILVRLSETLPGDDVLFSVWEDLPGMSYHVTPGRRIIRTERGKVTETVDRDQLAATPFLRQSLRIYLSSSDSTAGDLQFLLRDLKHIDGEQYAYDITSDYKRWWIGSAIAAATNVGMSPREIRDLSLLLGRMLQGWDCGVPLPPSENTHVEDFPIPRPNDPDTRMALFSATECRELASLLQALKDRHPKFGAAFSLNPGDDPVAWDAHVREMISRFLKLKYLVPPCTHLVTFIG